MLKESASVKGNYFSRVVTASFFWPLISTSCDIFWRYLSARISSKQNSVAPLSSSSLQYILFSLHFSVSFSFCCSWSLFRGVSSLHGFRADKTVFTDGLILHGVLCCNWEKCYFRKCNLITDIFCKVYYSHSRRLIWLLNKWLKGWFSRRWCHENISIFSFLTHLENKEKEYFAKYIT